MYDDYYDDEELVLVDRPRRRRRNPTAAQASGGAFAVILLALIGWLVWYRNSKGRFPWQSIPAPTPVSRLQTVTKPAMSQAPSANARSGIGFRSIPTIPENLDDLGLTVIEP